MVPWRTPEKTGAGLDTVPSRRMHWVLLKSLTSNSIKLVFVSVFVKGICILHPAVKCHVFLEVYKCSIK